MINIVIVDDDQDSAFALKRNIDGQDEINVLETFNSGYDAIKYCENNCPDIVLMDINMPEIDGIRTSKIIKGIKPHIKILFLTGFSDKQFVLKAAEFNCEGFVLKGHKTDSVIRIIKNTFNGFNTYDNSILDVYKIELQNETEKIEQLNLLTPGEQSIVKLITYGKTDAQIAKELYMSEGHLRNTLVSIRKKVGVKNSKELAVWGLKRGL